MTSFRLVKYNEYSLLVTFPGLSLQHANIQVVLLEEFCSRYCQQWLFNQVPAYESLLLICNSPENVNQVIGEIKQFFQKETPLLSKFEVEEIIVPVCYDLSLGNDLEQMAAIHKTEIENIVTCHFRVVYHTYMLGFLPGFAYMGEVDEQIATPRKPFPVATRAGAVGIAGRQTGIYPVDSPGGWNIVGYTPLKMFDLSKPSPTLLKPGNAVRFIPIDLETYNAFIGNENGSN